MIWFGWVFRVSTIVGYLMPNLLHAYIFICNICKHILLVSHFHESEIIFVHSKIVSDIVM